MQKILKIKINKRLEFFLLGIDMKLVQKRARTIVRYMLLSPRILYAKFWKTVQIPRTFEWLNKLIFMAEMDKITRKLRERDDKRVKEDWVKLRKYRVKYGTRKI